MKGQAFAVFKMMIGAVFAVGLLVLIYAAVSGLNYPISGIDETKNLLLQAVRANDLCFERELLRFTEGESFGAEVFGFSSIDFDSSAVADIDCNARCEVTADSEIPVSAECTSGQDCTIWFGSGCR
jgi:hypothetical protein